jgi:hypothetical protein
MPALALPYRARHRIAPAQAVRLLDRCILSKRRPLNVGYARATRAGRSWDYQFCCRVSI